jgi:hypothetical protein
VPKGWPSHPPTTRHRRLWKRRELEKSNTRLSHRAWKSRKHPGIPTFPPPRLRRLAKPQNRTFHVLQKPDIFTCYRQPLLGRAALVSGASWRKGIGFAITRRLASQGAGLFISFLFERDRSRICHVQQVPALVDDKHPTVLEGSLVEGATEFTAELISGRSGIPSSERQRRGAKGKSRPPSSPTKTRPTSPNGFTTARWKSRATSATGSDIASSNPIISMPPTNAGLFAKSWK